MSTEQALLAAIWEHPHDDTSRLVYADWLDETGDPAKAARAEFIRVQCELERMPGDDPRYDALEAREEELSDRWESRWWAAMPPGCKRGHFARGFPVPTLERYTLGGLVKLTDQKLRAAPLWRYHYGVYGRDLDTLLAWPRLDRLVMFALRPPLPKDWVARLVGCDRLRNVAELQLIRYEPTADELRLLLDAWVGRHLTSLRFDPAKLREDGFELLANHPTSAGLRDLRLEADKRRPAPPGAVATLVRGRSLVGLRHLTLEGFGLTGDEFGRLLRWRHLGGLRTLSLMFNRLTDADARRLAGCGGAANLRRLWLDWNRVGADGARALVGAPHLARLEYLTLFGNPAGRDRAAVDQLRARFGDRTSA
jgi:uncharacterized protein (TIGR02996 family)